MWRFGSLHLKRVILACVTISLVVVCYNLVSVNNTSTSLSNTGKNIINKAAVQQLNDNGVPDFNQEDEPDEPVVNIKISPNQNKGNNDKIRQAKNHDQRSINNHDANNKHRQQALPIRHAGLRRKMRKKKRRSRLQKIIDSQLDRFGGLDNGKGDQAHAKDSQFHQDDSVQQHPDQPFNQFPVKSNKNKQQAGQLQVHNVQEDHDIAFSAGRRGGGIKRDDEDEMNAQMHPFDKNVDGDEPLHSGGNDHPAKSDVQNVNKDGSSLDHDQSHVQDENDPMANQEEINDPFLKAHLQNIAKLKKDSSQVGNELDPIAGHHSNNKQSVGQMDQLKVHADHERVQQSKDSSIKRNGQNGRNRLPHKKKFPDNGDHNQNAVIEQQNSDGDDGKLDGVDVELQRMKQKLDNIAGNARPIKHKIRTKRSRSYRHRAQKGDPFNIGKDTNMDEQSIKSFKRVKQQRKHMDEIETNNDHSSDQKEDGANSFIGENNNNIIEQDMDDSKPKNSDNAVNQFDVKSFKQDEDEIKELRKQQHLIEQNLMKAKSAVEDNSIKLPLQRKTQSIGTRPIQSSAETKVILLWTQYYQFPNWKLDFDTAFKLPLGRRYFKKYCKVKNCFLTANKLMYKRSHAIIFNDYDLPDHIAQMPNFKDRQPWQRWVYHNIESPHFAIGSKSFFVNAGMFNWSMTYFDNADIDIRYGYIVQRQLSPSKPLADYHGSKQQLVTWVVSHCLRERMHYVKVLSKYIPIKIYGACGNNTCNGTNNYCWKNVFSRSMFYLAFENSICNEYITEKFWNPLRYGVIPVVLGGGNYRKIAPPKSYIDASDFLSVKDLAAYLYKVSRNKQLYNSYMQWKSKWKVVVPKHWCNLCAALHDPHRPPKVYTTLSRDWDYLNRQCKPYPIPHEYFP